jgi:hypothetical protein
MVGNVNGMRGVGQIAGKEVNTVLNVNIIFQLYCSLLSRFIVRFGIAALGCWRPRPVPVQGSVFEFVFNHIKCSGYFTYYHVGHSGTSHVFCKFSE